MYTQSSVTLGFACLTGRGGRGAMIAEDEKQSEIQGHAVRDHSLRVNTTQHSFATFPHSSLNKHDPSFYWLLLLALST